MILPAYTSFCHSIIIIEVYFWCLLLTLECTRVWLPAIVNTFLYFVLMIFCGQSQRFTEGSSIHES